MDHLMFETVKNLSERVLNDHKIGRVDQNNKAFKDLLFLPVNLIMCDWFISEEVEEIVIMN